MDLGPATYCFDTAPFFDAQFDVSAWVHQTLGADPKEGFLEQVQNDLARCPTHRVLAALSAECPAIYEKIH